MNTYTDQATDRGQTMAYTVAAELDNDTIRVVLVGIRDGDSETMDAYSPPAPLSGEWAGESIPELLGEPPARCPDCGDTVHPTSDGFYRHDSARTGECGLKALDTPVWEWAAEDFDDYETAYHDAYWSKLETLAADRVLFADCLAVRDLNAHQLAYRADCASPDSPDSAGAQYLRTVADTFVDAVLWNAEHSPDTDIRDQISEIVDGCVPIYTHQLWSTFVDLAAYSEEIDAFTFSVENVTMEDLARVAVYMIGERLADSFEIGATQ